MPPQSWPLRRNAEFREALRALDKTVTEIVSNRASATGEHGDLLDMLIDARDEETNAQMDAMQLRDEVATIFSAGHETTAAALAWSWYLLNAHSEIERRVTEEVDSVIGERRITADDFDRLKFTRAVFEEALRLYPPGPLVPQGVGARRHSGWLSGTCRCHYAGQHLSCAPSCRFLVGARGFRS